MEARIEGMVQDIYSVILKEEEIKGLKRENQRLNEEIKKNQDERKTSED